MRCKTTTGTFQDRAGQLYGQILTSRRLNKVQRPFCPVTADLHHRNHRALCVYAKASSTETTKAPQRPTFKPSAPADWAKLQELQKSKETVTIQIDSLRQNGAVFQLHGVEGFIYFDELAYARVLGGAAPTEIVGKKIDVKIIIAEEGKRGLRASEIARLTQEKAAQIHVDDVVDGVVSHCTDFGAFVRIGDEKELTSVEGLIHISELSWNKVFTPEAVVTPGTLVQCRVVSVDRKQGRIGLSLKVQVTVVLQRMSADPLKEQLETLLADDSRATIPTEVHSSIKKIVDALKDESGVQDVSLGRQIEEKAVSQELEIWMTTANVEQEKFVLIVREGRTVQELNVSGNMSKQDMKQITQRILKAFA